jgi:diguanylate cyclase (GGDEF)-like protein
MMHRVGYTVSGLQLVPVGWSVADEVNSFWVDATDTAGSLPADPFLRSVLESEDACIVAGGPDDQRIGFSVGSSDELRWLIEIHTPVAPSEIATEGVKLFLRCFENQLRQWEFANLDTLTRLLNRKTFDAQFDLIIAEADRSERQASERRQGDPQDERPSWLGVADIDHFKRINDNFGHLFGDEVLLRIADLMRASFRSGDKLFRFGGEEFVVMLRNVAEDDVGAVFERFRVAVELHEFPQVGRVTCSLGYCRIDARLSPAELLGQADEALYYGKEHGRNQINGYEDLTTAGKLSISKGASGSAQADADVLFD